MAKATPDIHVVAHATAAGSVLFDKNKFNQKFVVNYDRNAELI